MLSSTNLLHAAVRPSLHPLDRTLAVKSWVALTVNGEVRVGAVHDQDNVEVPLNSYYIMWKPKDCKWKSHVIHHKILRDVDITSDNMESNTSFEPVILSLSASTALAELDGQDEQWALWVFICDKNRAIDLILWQKLERLWHGTIYAAHTPLHSRELQ